MIAPNKVIEMGGAITGVIEAIPVERSDHVEAGEVVVQLEQATAALERRTIRSPVSGYVIERLMDPRYHDLGDLLNPFGEGQN